MRSSRDEIMSTTICKRCKADYDNFFHYIDENRLLEETIYFCDDCFWIYQKKLAKIVKKLIKDLSKEVD